MGKLDDILKEIKSELGADLITAGVIGMDGLPIAEITINPDFDGSTIAARFAMMMKLASKVAAKTQVGGVDENLVTTDEAYIITRFLGDGSYFLGGMVTRDATLGIVRMTAEQYAGDLWDAIPK